MQYCCLVAVYLPSKSNCCKGSPKTCPVGLLRIRKAWIQNKLTGGTAEELFVEMLFFNVLLHFSPRLSVPPAVFSPLIHLDSLMVLLLVVQKKKKKKACQNRCMSAIGNQKFVYFTSSCRDTVTPLHEHCCFDFEVTSMVFCIIQDFFSSISSRSLFVKLSENVL